VLCALCAMGACALPMPCMCVAHAVCVCEWGHSMLYRSVCVRVCGPVRVNGIMTEDPPSHVSDRVLVCARGMSE
jgi:hypothetical protein